MGDQGRGLDGGGRQLCHIEQLKLHQPIAPTSYKKLILSLQLEASSHETLW